MMSGEVSGGNLSRQVIREVIVAPLKHSTLNWPGKYSKSFCKYFTKESPRTSILGTGFENPGPGENLQGIR
jgi:hypothetical protein